MQQFEALFEYATIGIVVADSSGRIINYNGLAAQQFGYDREEIIGQPVEVLIPVPSRKAHIRYRSTFNEDPHPRAMGAGRDLFGQKKNGETFPVEVSLSHYISEGQHFVIAFIIDITIRKQHEALMVQQKQELERISSELKKLNAELEQKVEDRTKMLRETLAALEKSKQEVTSALEKEKELGELKSRFVTMASHEFRTPLSTILSSVYLLEQYNKPFDEKKDKHLQRIRSAVGNMQSILNDFLSLGKLEEGRIKVNVESLPATAFNEQISRLVEELEGSLKEGQRFDICALNSNVPVDIDKHLLKAILLNLFSNAIKFSPEHSAIRVECRQQPGSLSVCVSDRGIGISEEDQQHLFERFFRAQNAANIQGTGLGLHIVGKYLELLHGTAQIESRLNEGTTVCVTIPQPIPQESANKPDSHPNHA